MPSVAVESGASGYAHAFPTIRGVQAKRQFFVALCPLKVVPRLFVFDEEGVPAQLRAQRTLNRARVPEIAAYLVANHDSYVLSAISASVDCPVRFEPYGDSGAQANMGLLHIPMDARILINDGQHRRKAIEIAMKQKPELAQENIPVIFFVDQGLRRSQQMFADLNKYAIRPSGSLSTLYDHREPASEVARYLAENCSAFNGMTEFERSSISNRSTKLFTLSSIKHASRALLRKGPKDVVSTEEKLVALEFWEAIADAIPDWSRAKAREVTTAELRQNYIHAHGIALHALGIAGAHLLAAEPKTWRRTTKKLKGLDWSRKNAKLWAGRAMVHGKISKARANLQLTAMTIKRAWGLPLSPSELSLEKGLK